MYLCFAWKIFTLRFADTDKKESSSGVGKMKMKPPMRIQHNNKKSEDILSDETVVPTEGVELIRKKKTKEEFDVSPICATILVLCSCGMLCGCCVLCEEF
jgi:hypothetical protein